MSFGNRAPNNIHAFHCQFLCSISDGRGKKATEQTRKFSINNDAITHVYQSNVCAIVKRFFSRFRQPSAPNIYCGHEPVLVCVCVRLARMERVRVGRLERTWEQWYISICCEMMQRAGKLPLMHVPRVAHIRLLCGHFGQEHSSYEIANAQPSGWNRSMRWWKHSTRCMRE